MLLLKNIYKKFGGLLAVNGTSFTVEKGTIKGLIGPNGAGKTTLFNIIAGMIAPSSGQIFLDGENITNLKPYELFNKGLLRTFQISQEFSTLTVRDNLLMVPSNQPGENLYYSWFSPFKVKQFEKEIQKKADEVIQFLELENVSSELAKNLSGGQKKLLELGRTMMVDAKIVFLDEVGAGVNRTLLNKIGELILKLNRDKGYTFCMIEHDMEFISRLCKSVTVMAEGSVLAEGSVNEIKNNDEVIEAYLGKQNNKNGQKV
ncbi:MAG: ABC transporter ATP-binding protein [Paracoccaceae bacterium]|tara:strand:- start:35 stop:814 length:780 start_codon:yes stop_codon:yes gene_type:complete